MRLQGYSAWVVVAKSLTKTRSQREMSSLRFIKGQAECTASYDLQGTSFGGGPVLTVRLNGEVVLELAYQPGETGERRATVPLSLRKGSNELRLLTALYGPTPSTTARLEVTDDGRTTLECHYETARDVETIDQNWKLHGL